MAIWRPRKGRKAQIRRSSGGAERVRKAQTIEAVEIQNKFGVSYNREILREFLYEFTEWPRRQT